MKPYQLTCKILPIQSVGVQGDYRTYRHPLALMGAESCDFTTLDTIMPHPDYSSQFFLCVLSPSEATFERIRPMLAEAYDIAMKRYNKRKHS